MGRRDFGAAGVRYTVKIALGNCQVGGRQGLSARVALEAGVGRPADVAILGNDDLRGDVVAVATYSNSVIRVEGAVACWTVEQGV